MANETVNAEGLVARRVGHAAYIAGTITRPANTTAYSANAALGQTTVAGTCTPGVIQLVDRAGEAAAIKRVRIRKTATNVALASFRVHFFSVSPTGFVGDNTAFAANNAGYAGAVDVVLSGANGQVFLDGSFGVGLPNVGTDLILDLPAGATNAFFLIQVLAAYVPASAEVFTVEIEVAR